MGSAKQTKSFSWKPWCQLLLEEEFRVIGIPLWSVDTGNHRCPTHSTYCMMSVIDCLPCPGLLQQRRLILKKGRCPLRHLRKLLSISPSDRKVNIGFIIVVYIVWIIHWRRLSNHWEQKPQRNQGDLSPRSRAHLWEHPSPNASAGKLDKHSTISQWRAAKLACVTGAFPFRGCATTVSSKILPSTTWRSSLGAPPNPSWAQYGFNWAVCFMSGHFIVHREEHKRGESRWEVLFI